MSIIQQLIASFGGFAGYSTVCTGTGTVAIPQGASSVTIELIGAGADGYWDGGDGMCRGGGGGAYSKKNTYSVNGLTGIYLDVGAGATVARINNLSGTVICSAAPGGYPAGGLASYGVGDVTYSGGNGTPVLNGVTAGGGGAAGPNGNGGNAIGATGGVSGGGAAGSGGDGSTYQPGNNYGGGGGGNGYSGKGNGAQGWAKLTWA